MCVELTHTERRCSTAKTMFEIIFFFDVLPIEKKRIIFRSIQHTYECRRTKIPVALKIVAFFFFALLFKSFSFTLSFFVFLLSSFRFHYQIAGVFLFSSSSSYFSSIFNIMLFMFFVFVWC